MTNGVQKARCVHCRTEVSVPDTYAHGDHIKCGTCGTKHKVSRGEVMRIVLADVTPLREALRENERMVERLEDEIRFRRAARVAGTRFAHMGDEPVEPPPDRAGVDEERSEPAPADGPSDDERSADEEQPVETALPPLPHSALPGRPTGTPTIQGCGSSSPGGPASSAPTSRVRSYPGAMTSTSSTTSRADGARTFRRPQR